MAHFRCSGVNPTGNAVVGDVKAGKIFSNENDIDLVGTFAAQEKSATPSLNQQNIVPDTGKYLSKVTIAAMSVNIVVALNTSSFQNKPITVTDSGGTTVATTTFDSNGKAMIILSSAGTYTFTVTY